jgi:formylglycine-generating enzyme required for sulfatase activity
MAALASRMSDLERIAGAAGMAQTEGGMVLIPAGAFRMGDVFSEGGTDERPVHEVSVNAFYMDQYEVSKALWDEVHTYATGQGYAFDNAGAGKEGSHPVHTVNWYDCVKWANARSQRDGLTPVYYTSAAFTTVYKTGTATPYPDWSADGYRLPTEAEWEKAARGGASGRRFPWADANTIQHARANYYAQPSSYTYDTSPTTGYHGDYNDGTTPYTSPVGSFAPNGYGLYDMAGNLYEWGWDWYGSTDSARPPGTDPRGPASGSYRVFRGGFWFSFAYCCRVAFRYFDSPGSGSSNLGFRLVRAAQ